MLTPEEIRRYFPIVGLEIYPNSCARVLRYGGGNNDQMAIYLAKEQQKPFIDNEPNKRRIKEMSKKSMASLVFVTQSTEIEFTSMLTLTYPVAMRSVLNEKIIKDNLNAVLAMLRSRFNKDDNKLEYLWFMEFTKNDMPHFHVLLNVPAITPSTRWAITETWVKQLMTTASCMALNFEQQHVLQTKIARVILHRKSFELIRDTQGARKYVAKYATKREQKILPINWEFSGRFWGCSKGVSPEPEGVIPMTEEQLRGILSRYRSQEFMSRMEVVPKLIWNIDLQKEAMEIPDEIPF